MNIFYSTVYFIFQHYIYFTTPATVLVGISGTTKQLNMQCYQHSQQASGDYVLFGGQ
jgi:hypothetical protein